MVGGKVVETIVLHNRVWVNTYCDQEQDHCAIYVERNAASEYIAPGDSLWWQGGYAYWTPEGRAVTDYAIERIGYSGVNRPTPEMIEAAMKTIT